VRRDRGVVLVQGLPERLEVVDALDAGSNDSDR
jgi:hypothetical protein